MAASTPPPVVDPASPNAARMYDFMLFGRDNFEVDRAAVRRLVQVEPTGIWVIREHRAFLGRAVRFLTAECGLRQFIDFGSGLPTRDNVHEVAQRSAPDARVVYVDNDPVVLAYGRALLADSDATTVVEADLANPEEILGDPEVRRLIDFDQPVGLLYFEVLDGLAEEADPWGVVRRALGAVPPGSYLAASAVTTQAPEHAQALTRTAKVHLPHWGRVLGSAEIERFFEGLEVVPPGVGNVGAWRLDLGPVVVPRPAMVGTRESWPREWDDDVVTPQTPRTAWTHGGVARKP